jgi:hypothetical protein
MVIIAGRKSTPNMMGCLHGAEVTASSNWIQTFSPSTCMTASSIQLKSKLKARDGPAHALNATTSYSKW